MKEIPKRILICISGSIAAYKSADLVSALVKKGFEVKCLMTQSAKQFVTPLTLETLSHRSVATDLWGDGISGTEHIRLARWPDVIAFIPATAHLIARLSHGLSDDLVTTVALATEASWLVAPAMNAVMWANPVTQENVQRLKNRNVQFIEPNEGLLACGEEGSGKLASIDSLVGAIEKQLACSRLKPRTQPMGELSASDQAIQSWKNQKLLITAGPTVSRIDAVRYITNPSTGTMGVRLAEAAVQKGAKVNLILGKDKGTAFPDGIDLNAQHLKVVLVETAEEMLEASLKEIASVTAVIATAAVLDYRIKKPEPRKQKRSNKAIRMELVPSVDVLGTLVQKLHATGSKAWTLGFAAETDQMEKNARAKLKKKKLDFVFGNWISAIGNTKKTGFGTDQNAGILFDRDGGNTPFELDSKRHLAEKLLTELETNLRSKGRFL